MNISISNRALYSILSITILILASVVISGFWVDQNPYHDANGVKVSIDGFYYDLQEAIDDGIIGGDVLPETCITGEVIGWDGSSWTCDSVITSELDPQVGTLTSGKWCTSDGTDIDCTSNEPAGGGSSVWTDEGSSIYSLTGNGKVIGTTPKLTIGDGGQEDAGLHFDGEQQDYYAVVETWYSGFHIGRGAAEGADDVIVIPRAANRPYYSNTGTIADARVWCSGGLTPVTSTSFQCDAPKAYFYDGSDNVWEKRHVYHSTNNLNAVCLALGGMYSGAPEGVFGYLNWLADIGNSNNWGRIGALDRRAIDWVECNVLS